MFRTSVLLSAIAVIGCAHQHAQDHTTSQQAVQSLGRMADSQAQLGLADAPRHAADEHNAALGTYVMPANDSQAQARDAEAPPAPARVSHKDPNASTTDPDFGAFDSMKRNLDASDVLTTTGEQGTSETDRALTQSIRKVVLADKRLSYNAKNVSIVTKDGHVTLRGVVNSGKERAALDDIVRGIAGQAHVDNELRLK
ncbi:MAG: BON domain-containing protein [Myxococcales bacterium]